MRKYFLSFILCFTAFLNAQDTPPNWTVNPASYQFNASMIASLRYNNAPAPEGNNIVGVFAGSEVRGVATPIQVGNDRLFFITIYSNTAGEQLSLKAYIASVDTIANITEQLVFQPNAVYGGVANPYQLNAIFNLNRPPVLAGIPDQTIPFGGSFAAINLRNYSSDPDGDSLIYSYSNANPFTVTISAQGLATVTAPQGYSGSVNVIFRAAEFASGGLFAEDTVVLRVLRNDTPPQLNGIPNEKTGKNTDFNSFNLNDYLTENDGDSVKFSYETAPVTPQPAPVWSVNPSQYQFTMTLVAEISSLGKAGGSTPGLLAAFSGAELRGVTQQVTFAGKYLYFLTIYSNTNGDNLTFKFYDDDSDRLAPIDAKLTFVQNSSVGTPTAPLKAGAGYIVAKIDNTGRVSFVSPDATWSGIERLLFKVTDKGTINQYSDTANVYLEKLQENNPVLRNIPDQTINSNGLFTSFDLDNYLTELDGDAVVYTHSGSSQLQVSIGTGNIVSVTAPQGWVGEENILFKVTDVTANQLSSTDTVRFKVLTADNPPDISQVPGQTIGSNANFSLIDLRSYVTEVDGDSLKFSYSFVETASDPNPTWAVNAAQYQLTMNVIAEVTAMGKSTNLLTGKLSAWNGNEIRGVGSPVSFNGKTLYYMTLYGNSNGDTLKLRYYDPVSQRNIPVAERIQFIQNTNLGSPTMPHQLRAGNIVVSLNPAGVAKLDISDRGWNGAENITFYVEDMNTINRYKDSTTAEFRVLQDRAPLLAGIPDQTITGGQNFNDIDLDDYLSELDGDTVEFSVSGNNMLNVTILPGNVARVSYADTAYNGTEYIRFRAADRTMNGLFSIDTVMYKVLPRDNAPLVGNIPNQSIGLGGTFNSFDLDSYLTEVDGDSVEWSYQILPPDTLDISPNWNVNPAGFELTMSIIAKVKSVGVYRDGNKHKLAVFAGGQLRGVASPVAFGSEWIYFLTAYANSNGEQLNFKYFDSTNMKVYPVKQKIAFLGNGVSGSVNNPLLLEAGFIVIDLGTDNFVQVALSDNQWSGTEKVKFSVQDKNTLNNLSTSRVVSFRVLPTAIQQIAAPSSLNALAMRRPLRNRLTWTDNAVNETQYVVERKLGDSVQTSSYVSLDTLPAGTTVYEDLTVADTTVYTYRIYAYNTETTSLYSNQKTIKSIYTILPISSPNFQSLVNVQPGRVLVSWNDLANNETGYRVWRKLGDTLSGEPYAVVSTLPANSSAFADTSVQFVTQYSYRIEGFNSDTTSDFSRQLSIFTFPQIPEVPMLTSPGNNSIGVIQPVTFRWNSAARTEKYLFTLATDSLFQNVVLFDSTLTDTFKMVPVLNDLTNYYWKMQARNIGGYSPVSPVYTFRTIGGATSTMPLVPANYSVNVSKDTVAFYWSKSRDITMNARTILGYWFELYADSGTVPMIVDTMLTDTFRTVTNLSYFTNYYWRVRAKNETGWNNFSQFYNFRTIIEKPAEVHLASPVNGAAVESPILFNWKTAARATNYVISVASDSLFTNIVRTNTITDTSITMNLTIPVLQPHYWKVAANNDGGSTVSSTYLFTRNILPAQTTLVSPGNSAVHQPVNISLVWNAVYLAERYQLQLSTDSSFAAFTVNDSIITDTTRLITGLQNDKNYYWRVRAANVIGNGEWSARYMFKTIVPNPLVPVLVTPGNGAVNTPVSFIIRWRKDRYTETYHLQIAKDSLFTQFHINDSLVTDTVRLLQNLVDGKSYYWRVSGKNIAGVSQFSEQWKFTTKMNAPDSLTITAIPGRIAQLQWLDRSSGETNYRVERKSGNAASPEPYVVIAVLPENTVSYRDSVAGDTLVYTYRVQAAGSLAISQYSNTATTTLVTDANENGDIPVEFSLSQNYPNPFNPSTTIEFALPANVHTLIEVYDILGSRVKTLLNEEKEAGYYSIPFEMGSLAAGTYIYRIQAGNYTAVKKMIYLK